MASKYHLIHQAQFFRNLSKTTLLITFTDDDVFEFQALGFYQSQSFIKGGRKARR